MAAAGKQHEACAGTGTPHTGTTGTLAMWDRQVLGLDKRDLLRNVVLPAVANNRYVALLLLHHLLNEGTR